MFLNIVSRNFCLFFDIIRFCWILFFVDRFLDSDDGGRDEEKEEEEEEEAEEDEEEAEVETAEAEEEEKEEEDKTEEAEEEAVVVEVEEVVGSASLFSQFAIFKD